MRRLVERTAHLKIQVLRAHLRWLSMAGVLAVTAGETPAGEGGILPPESPPAVTQIELPGETLGSTAGETPAATIATNFVIGLLLPETEPLGQSVREGALLAVEHFNKSGRASARLVIRGAAGQWGTDGVEAARMVTDDGAQGLIAPANGAASHLALQVAGRTAVPVFSLCGDSSVTQTGVPWMVRLTPQTGDEAKAIFNGLKPAVKRWIAFVPAGRRGREIARDLSKAASASAVALTKTIEVNWPMADPTAWARRALTNRVDGILLWLDPMPAAACLKQLGAAGFVGRLAGPTWLRCADFEDGAGPALNSFIRATHVADQKTETRFAEFAEAFRFRFCREPDTMAAMSYDAAQLLLQVLYRADNRPAHALFPIGFSFAGATGVLSFDSQGNRKVPLELREGLKRLAAP